MEDCNSKNRPLSEKRRLLKDYVSRRDNLEPEAVVSEEIYDFVEGVHSGVAYRPTSTGVRFTQLSFPSRGIARAEWEIQIEPPLGYVIDPPQDLLLAMYQDANANRCLS